jgi:cytochrome c553
MFAAAVLAAGGAQAAEAAKQPSTCVACHTDMAKLQEEAKGIPVPTGSALQSGKG